MAEREIDLGDYREIGERYWYLSRIYRTARSFLGADIGQEVDDDRVFVFIKKAKEEKTWIWNALSIESQFLLREDFRGKSMEMIRKNPGLKDLDEVDRRRLVIDKLHKEYFGLSKKAPRHLRELGEYLFKDES